MVHSASTISETNLVVKLTGLPKDIEVHTTYVPGDGVSIRFWCYADGFARKALLPRELQEEAIAHTLEVCDEDF